MAEELDLDLDNEDENIKNNKVERRIKDLSEKVKLTSEERDELAQAKVKAEEERDIANKERDFFKDFSTSASKYQGATEYQDKIWEKVKLGYTVEDATVSVLNAEGKFTPTAQESSKESPAGGSATNSMKGDGDKTVSEMTQAEKREELRKQLGG